MDLETELDIVLLMFAKMNLNDAEDEEKRQDYVVPTSPMDVDADDFMPMDVDADDFMPMEFEIFAENNTAMDIDVDSMELDDVDCLDWEPIVSEITPCEPDGDVSHYHTENKPMFSPFHFQSVYRLA